MVLNFVKMATKRNYIGDVCREVVSKRSTLVYAPGNTSVKQEVQTGVMPNSRGVETPGMSRRPASIGGPLPRAQSL